MTQFTPLSSLLGGVLIGLSSIALLAFNGRIAGISGILGGAMWSSDGGRPWRVAFLAGLITAGIVGAALFPTAYANTLPRSLFAVVAAGLLVGYATRLGSGCTSGHGVCGISRLSPRSLVATATFMATGIATATVVRVAFGGVL
jgi:uncharacterized membrane protein YedE/YeeE